MSNNLDQILNVFSAEQASQRVGGWKNSLGLGDEGGYLGGHQAGGGDGGVDLLIMRELTNERRRLRILSQVLTNER